jgi:hypothetical protein
LLNRESASIKETGSIYNKMANNKSVLPGSGGEQRMPCRMRHCNLQWVLWAGGGGANGRVTTEGGCANKQLHMEHITMNMKAIGL